MRACQACDPRHLFIGENKKAAPKNAVKIKPKGTGIQISFGNLGWRTRFIKSKILR